MLDKFGCFVTTLVVGTILTIIAIYAILAFVGFHFVTKLW